MMNDTAVIHFTQNGRALNMAFSNRRHSLNDQSLHGEMKTSLQDLHGRVRPGQPRVGGISLW